MIITYEHNLGKEIAYQRVCQAIDKYRSRVKDPIVNWDETNTHVDLSARYSIARLSGQIDLDDKNIILQGEVHRIILATFGRNIEERAVKKLKQIFS
jgi:hypothetical protein